jgi:hypothetical protein
MWAILWLGVEEAAARGRFAGRKGLVEGAAALTLVASKVGARSKSAVADYTMLLQRVEHGDDLEEMRDERRDPQAVSPGSGPVQNAGSPNLLFTRGTSIAKESDASKLL